MEHIYKIRTHINSSKPLHGLLKHYPNTIVFDESEKPDAFDDMKKYIASLLTNLTASALEYKMWLDRDDEIGFSVYRDATLLAYINSTVEQWSVHARDDEYLGFEIDRWDIRIDSARQTIIVGVEVKDDINRYGIVFGDHLIKIVSRDGSECGDYELRKRKLYNHVYGWFAKQAKTYDNGW